MSADLVLSHFSLGRHIDFATRVRAAAEAGFVGIGLWVGDYRRLRAAGHRDADLRAVLDHYGLRVVEYEALRGWAAHGAELAASRADEADLYRMADALGADTGGNLQVLGPYPGTAEQAAEALGGVADRAAEHGLTASVEFLPEMTNIADAGAAWELARLSGRPNAGVCVDSWHHFRGVADLGLLASVPAGRVFVVQLNDGPRTRVDPDYYTDCTRYRLPPGDGDFDLATFLRALADMGVPARYSVEVLSTALLERESPADLAQLLAAATRELLARTFGDPASNDGRRRA
jgi:sugar phosphate isomerase/epimerase